MKLDRYFTSFTKINSKLYENLNMIIKALKSLEVNIKEYLSDLVVIKDIFKLAQCSITTKTDNSSFKLNYLEVKSSYSSRYTIKRRSSHRVEDIFNIYN